MTKKLLVTIALGAALAIVAAGTATSITVGTADLPVDTGGTGGALPACADLSDNDGDGLIDMADPGCSSPTDTDEYNAPTSSGGSGGGSGGGGSGGSGGDSVTVGSGSSSGSSSGGTVKVSGKSGKSGGTQGLFGKQAKKGQGAKEIAKAEKGKISQPTLRNPDGSPTDQNPGLTVAQFGPAPIGVPNFVIDS